MLPFRSFNKMMQLIPSFWSIFLTTLPSMLIVVSSQIDPLFPEGHRAGRLSMDRCIFEARKRTACIHGWLSIPCRTRSFVLGTGAIEFCGLTPRSRSQPSVFLLLPLAPGIWLCGSSYTSQICTIALSTGISTLLSFVEMTCWHLWCFIWRGVGWGIWSWTFFFWAFFNLFYLCFATQWMCFLPLSLFVGILVFIKVYSCHEMNLV